MKKVGFFGIILFLEMAGGVFAKSTHPVFLQNQWVPFFASRAFRLLGKTRNLGPAKKDLDFSLLTPTNLFENLETRFSPQVSALALTQKLRVESGYVDFEFPESKGLPVIPEYAKILKSSALGLAYPLTPRLLLSGHYAFIKREGIGGSSLSPFLGATYRLNTATSISLNYLQSSGQDSAPAADSQDFHHTSAKLQIHF